MARRRVFSVRFERAFAVTNRSAYRLRASPPAAGCFPDPDAADSADLPVAIREYVRCVSAPASPHAAASGISPMPAESSTIKQIRLKIDAINFISSRILANSRIQRHLRVIKPARSADKIFTLRERCSLRGPGACAGRDTFKLDS